MEIITKRNVKAFLKENKKRIASATYTMLNNEVEALLKRACKRAETNGRNTIMPQDI